MTGVINDQTAVQIGRVLGVHELLTGKITQIMHRPARTSSRTYREQKKVADHKEKYRNSKGKIRERWVWIDVSATITANKKTATSAIMGSFKIIDVATAKIKKSESFKGTGFFMSEWGTARGDERALSDASKTLISQTEQFEPSSEELVNSAARDLSEELAAKLKTYAR